MKKMSNQCFIMLLRQWKITDTVKINKGLLIFKVWECLVQIHPNSLLFGPFEPLSLHHFLEFCEREYLHERNINMKGLGLKD